MQIKNHNEISGPHQLEGAIIKKSGKQTGAGERRNRNTLHCWWDCKLVQPLWKTVWQFLKDLELEMPFDPALLGIYQRIINHAAIKTHTRIWQALFTVAKDLEPIQNAHSMWDWDEENVAHTPWDTMQAHKNGWVHVLAGTWMKLEIIILSKLSQGTKTKHRHVSP